MRYEGVDETLQLDTVTSAGAATVPFIDQTNFNSAGVHQHHSHRLKSFFASQSLSTDSLLCLRQASLARPEVCNEGRQAIQVGIRSSGQAGCKSARATAAA